MSARKLPGLTSPGDGVLRQNRSYGTPNGRNGKIESELALLLSHLGTTKTGRFEANDSEADGCSSVKSAPVKTESLGQESCNPNAEKLQILS